MSDKSQGAFHVKRRLDGAVVITCPPVVVVPPYIAVKMARAILKEAGVEVVFADPWETNSQPLMRRVSS
jgi:hypothetical protein